MGILHVLFRINIQTSISKSGQMKGEKWSDEGEKWSDENELNIEYE
jgi:hypothetical protein